MTVQNVCFNYYKHLKWNWCDTIRNILVYVMTEMMKTKMFIFLTLVLCCVKCFVSKEQSEHSQRPPGSHSIQTQGFISSLPVNVINENDKFLIFVFYFGLTIIVKLSLLYSKFVCVFVQIWLFDFFSDEIFQTAWKFNAPLSPVRFYTFGDVFKKWDSSYLEVWKLSRFSSFSVKIIFVSPFWKQAVS